MRNFDIRVRDYNLTQYWSSLVSSGNNVTGQVANSLIGDLIFTANPVVNNRNITSDSQNSILLSSNAGIFASTTGFENIQLSMLLYPNVSDLWIVKLQHATLDIGVRIDAGGVMTLAYPVEEVLVEETITYDEQVSYFLFSVIGSAASVVLNEKTISIEGDFLSFDGAQLGGGTGSALIDKVAVSFSGNLPFARDYARVFKSIKLDTVPRPFGAASFAYISDTLRPYATYLDATDFNYDNGFYYSHARNTLPSARTAIHKLAPFDIEYSVDQMVTWTPLAADTYLPDTISEVVFRHSEESAYDYSVAVLFTDSSVDPLIMPLADFDVSISGDIYLADDTGSGYYDVETGNTSSASIAIAGEVRTVEALVEFNSTPTAFVSTDIVSTKTYYVNGVVCSDLSVLKLNQVYHVVVTFSAAASVATISGDIKLAGIGAASMAYSASDAYNIFGTFAGNTLIDVLEEIPSLKDGIHAYSEDNLPGIVYDLQWNS
ncbi:hypothetical protein FDI69_gp067 [Rhodococcus phage Trina]|uniref:Uncharacterized protein n=1 Tax=Rhodococcus phage Trina TaxID=2027905 RepID=A0A2D0ZMY3_9CAUD|nr:hypothetical protein FDI69_gp067 [Rhodococcus phage Trina]ASZ74881.1 hypothetical protein SEA_TRINA_67 [Rhodococcus phage Trina]